MKINVKIKDAIKDFRFLLNRGYRRSVAIDFVSNHYRLSKQERHLLTRAIFSDAEIKARRKKLTQIGKIKGKHLAVDGYNVIITLESMLQNRLLILCDDGFVRDISAVFGKHKITETTLKALNKLFKLLSKYPPAEIQFFLDQPVSHSGELAGLIRGYIKKNNLVGEAITTKAADRAIIEAVKKGGIVASSDRSLIEKARFVVNIPNYFARNVIKVS